jgi:hypothetical protein
MIFSCQFCAAYTQQKGKNLISRSRRRVFLEEKKKANDGGEF